MSLNLRNYVETVYAFDHVIKLVTENPAKTAKILARQTRCADWKGADVIGRVLGGTNRPAQWGGPTPVRSKRPHVIICALIEATAKWPRLFTGRSASRRPSACGRLG